MRFRVLGASAIGIFLTLSPCFANDASNNNPTLYSFRGQSDGWFPLAGVININGDLYGTSLGGAHAHGNVYKVTQSGVQTVIYTFLAKGDGNQPYGGLIVDSAGNLYGATVHDGDRTCDCGVVYKISPTGQESVLYKFKGGSDGAFPLTTLATDSAGNLYGTTQRGGTYDAGTIFQLAPDGGETILYSFGRSGDGKYPQAGVAMDRKGNLYGTTARGGKFELGAAYEYIAARHKEKVLHSFGADANDGTWPVSSLVLDKSGNVYGTADLGGSTGGGTVFKIAPDGTETTLHTFATLQDNGDGCEPAGPLLRDKDGNMFGTTTACGAYPPGGTLFEIDAAGEFKVLHSFINNGDGYAPNAGLIQDRKGNLFGTTYYGGDYHPANCYPDGCGTVFKLKP